MKQDIREVGRKNDGRETAIIFYYYCLFCSSLIHPTQSPSFLIILAQKPVDSSVDVTMSEDQGC